MAAYDLLGNIVLVKFPPRTGKTAKLTFARRFLRERTSVRTVLEKVEGFSGRLRTQTTRFLAGERTTEALYRENGCEFRFNVDTCYFSPRLAAERAAVARFVKRREKVLVLFGGVGPFAIVLAKTKKPARVVCVELGRVPSTYALENVKRNRVAVEVVQGDVRRVLPKMKETFGRIVMARPNLEDDFLDVVFGRVAKGGMIHYYGFYHESEVAKLGELIERRAREARRKIRILKVVRAGDIGPGWFRYRADVKVET